MSTLRIKTRRCSLGKDAWKGIQGRTVFKNTQTKQEVRCFKMNITDIQRAGLLRERERKDDSGRGLGG